MKNYFSAFHILSEHSSRDSWKSAVFVLDTNILLNLYRYPTKKRKQLIHVFEDISSQLWIPYHVGLEFHRNRINVITEQGSRFGDVRKILTEALRNIRSN